jgi:adenylylsulfate kinase-like enzyme
MSVRCCHYGTMTNPDPDTIFINGTVGTGKSTLANALGASETGVHAVIDLDDIRRLSPSPASDRFNHELELENLRSIAQNYRRAGARRFILAGVLEQSSEVSRYVTAVGSTGMFACRLVASSDVLDTRLRHRHVGDEEGLAWHRSRVGELAQILELAAIDDLVLDSSHRSPTELAHIVRTAAGWDTPCHC